MSKDDDFEQMLDGLEIVAESLEEESHTVLPRVDQLKRRRTLLDLQADLFDSKERQHALYRLYLNSTFRKFTAGVLIISFINLLLYLFADELETPGTVSYTHLRAHET